MRYVTHEELAACFSQLVEVHAAPPWLWSELVPAVLQNPRFAAPSRAEGRQLRVRGGLKVCGRGVGLRRISDNLGSIRVSAIPAPS